MMPFTSLLDPYEGFLDHNGNVQLLVSIACPMVRPVAALCCFNALATVCSLCGASCMSTFCLPALCALNHYLC